MIKSKRILKSVKVLLAFMLLVTSSVGYSQTPIPIGPQSNTFTSMVRGYHFIAPVNFTICGLYIPTDASMGLQSVEVVKFTNAAPPAFPGTTNAFTSQFYSPSYPTNAMIPCNIQINTGDIVGVYGARAANMVNSYDGVNYASTISTLPVTFSRSGMQANLSTGQMANIWSEVNYNIGRIIMYYECCPDPPTPQLTAAPTQICSNDTFTYSAAAYAFATGYTWDFGNSGTIVGANIDSSEVQVTYDGTVVFDTVCLTMFDSCSSSDTCFPVVINPPFAFAGNDTSICSTTFQLNGNQGNGYWTVLGGAGTFSNTNDFNSSVSGLAPGVNTLSWTISNNNCPAITDEINITVKPVPVAQMIVPDGCDQGQIQFVDDSYALNGNIIDWNWDVDGDGTFDYSTNTFNHTYAAPGTYQCTLVVTANQGCQDTLVEPIIVHPNPVTDFSYNSDCEGSPMAFNDLTVISSGFISDWEWDFGDGTTNSLAQGPAHVYANAGFYWVSLTATSNEGCTVTHSDSVQVYSIPDIDWLSPEMCQNDTVFYADSSTSVEGVINYWEWDFGDGSPIDYNQHTAHKYPTHNLYSVRLTVATNLGCTNTVVRDQRSFPVPQPNYLQDGVCEEQRVTFTDNSTVSNMFGSTFASFRWNFGDGDSAINPSVGHFYQDPGLYTLALTPYTNYGCHFTFEDEILIRPRPDAKILVVDDKVCARNEISYRDQTYFDYEFDAVGVVAWNWQFGNGASSSLQDPKNVFAKGGDYSTLLTVETGYGCIDSTRKTTVIYHNPKAEYRMDTLEGCSPHCVTFIDESKLSTGEDLIYNWNFGDGQIDVENVNPTYCYAIQDGASDVLFNSSLRVTSPNGCSDSYSSPGRIKVYSNPIADFDVGSVSVSELEPVVLIDNYSVGGDYWSWDFGDTSFSSLFNPIKHEYAEPGIYEIQLVTLTEFGCRDNISKRVNVERLQTIFIPSSFTPNGDGVNDFFEVYGADLQEVKLWIFDRWGNELFYGEDDLARWDGKIEGKLLPIGAYAYVLVYKQSDQIRQKKSGNFVISRSNN
ncbi:PKD domain-containing protein [Salibacteraceae bacterium]|nr:PKD domain-containing protein [Salibacteraceae bacterium]MDB9709677.1 PKD domain-containing protein [Salibacteraceae bacterium]